MLPFCKECGNMIKIFKNGKIVNGEFVEEPNHKIIGICIDENFTELNESEAQIKYNNTKKYPIDEEIIAR